MNPLFLRIGLSSFVLMSMAMPACAEAPEVPVARAVLREVTEHEDFTGRTEAAARVEVRARVSGYLLEAPFQEGTEVKQGDLLFQIEPRPYRAEMDKAEAALKRAEARFKLAEANHKRMKTLFDQKTATQEDLDKSTAERVVAEAEVRAAQVGCEVAKLNLSFTHVVAPIAGRIGRRTIDPGNLVKADETILATIISRDPVYVYFDVDERSLLRLLRSVREDKGKAEKFTVAVGLADEKGFSRRGTADVTDNSVDPNTGTLRMRARLPNKDGLLMPGLFVRVRLAMGAPHKALTIPEQTAIAVGGSGQRFIYVVNDKDVIEERTVKVGQEDEGWRIVKSGLKEGERVILGRLSELRPGMTVRPREREKPAPKPKPSSDSAPPAPSARGPGGLGVRVEAVYPGANAEVVSDVVRWPIEEQINGVEKLRSMRSRCTSDGQYALALSFGRGVDLKTMQVLVQNRVNLATPVLPEAVRNAGISIKRGTSGAVMIVNLISTEGDRDHLYLSNYANIQLKDDLARVPGVAEANLLGSSEYGLHIHLDPDRLAAFDLNAGEVTRMIEKQKELRGLDTDKLAELAVKTDGEGRMILLRDVASIEMGAGQSRNRASYNGKPVAALVIRPDGEMAPRKVRAALRDVLSRLRERLPNGLDLVAAFDFTMDTEHLLIDLDLPAAASAERIEKGLDRCQALLRQMPGVHDVLAMSENPFDLFGGGPCLLIALAPAKDRKDGRDEIARTIRAKLAGIAECPMRLRDLSSADRPAHFGYPIDLAIRGPERAIVRQFATKLAARLREDKKLSDVWMDPASEPRLQRTVVIDRSAAAARGVAVADILATLRVQEGPVYVNDFVRFGRTWRVQVQTETGSGDWIKDLRKLRVRGARGQMIPLNVLLKVDQTETPATLDFLDFWPMIEITANPASGVKLEAARKLCETAAAEVRKEMELPPTYRLMWLP